MRIVLSISRSILRLACCVFLLGGTLTLGALSFAYLTGDVVDRTAMQTTLLIKLHDLGLKSDQDIRTWVVTHRRMRHSELALEAFEKRAQEDPAWLHKVTTGAPLRSPASIASE